MTAACVIYVKDLDRMAAFYQQCLGLQALDGADGHRVLQSDAWTLSLVRTADEIGAAIDISVPARRRAEVPIKPGFAVRSIGEIRATAGAFGGQIDPPGAEWTFRGLRHCDGVDPEGNVIQLLEPLGGQA